MTRLHSPASERNREPILAVLSRVLPPKGLVLEIACGTGMHSVYFAPRLPHVVWQPTDIDEKAIASALAWQKEEPSDNLRVPIRLDVTQGTWPVDAAAAVFSANMIHIAPWEATLGLLRGSAHILSPGAPLVLYGPFRQRGVHTAESNAAFDSRLQSEDPSWGVRDLDVVTAEAEKLGFEQPDVVTMPANNLTVVFRKR